MKKITFTLVMALCAAMAFATGGEGNQLTHQMMTLALQVGVIIFAARMGNLLFTRLRLPSVLGELCAGVLIGPFALGKLCPGWVFQAAETSVGVSTELYGLCTIASIVLLFLVGAETDIKMFMRHSAVGSLVGIGGVIVSYITGAAVGVYVMGLEWSDPTTILMGVMSTATSVSITARILSERKKLDSQEGVTILAGAVIDDVLGIIMLAIGMGMITAKAAGETVSWGGIGLIAGQSLGIWLGATVVGIFVSRWVAKVLRPCGSTGEVAMMTLGLALLVGGLFEKAHLAMIIGAYVTGLSFSRTDLGILIQEKLHALYQFFVPIFFVVMGMMVDVSQFADKKILIAGLVYTLIAVLAKILGSGLPTLLFGFTPTGALRVGIGMVPRGEVALIIAGIAASHGHSEVLGVAVLMTLLTTLLAPPMLIQAFNIKRRGHKKEEEHDSEPLAIYHFPNRATTKAIMENIILNLSKEGFFTHQIDAKHELYQARQGETIITIHCRNTMIAFIAAKSTLPFVRVVMADALAEFETILSALRTPTGQVARLGIDADEGNPTTRLAAQRMSVLARAIQERNIILRLQATDRRGILHELLQRLRESGACTDCKKAEEEILRREEIMATGVGYGVACPHARTSAVKSLVCAIGITKEPIDFSDDEDGRGCRIIILTLTPEEENSPYMTFITAILTALRSSARREAVLEATDAPGIRKALLSP